MKNNISRNNNRNGSMTAVERDGIIVYYSSIPEQWQKAESRCAKMLLKYGFLDFFQVDLHDKDIGRQADGKPCYKNDKLLQFNISHCKNGIAAALAHRNIGVDIERMRPVSSRIVKKCCSAEEISYIFGQKERLKNENFLLSEEETLRFLELWTLKESYVKMTGEGLRRKLGEICFSPEDIRQLKKEGIQSAGRFDPPARHYLHLQDGLILALAVHWEQRDAAPRLSWQNISSERFAPGACCDSS